MGVMPQISQQAGCCTSLPPKQDRGVTGTKTCGLKAAEIKSRGARGEESQVKAATAHLARFGPVPPLRPCRSGCSPIKKGK